MACEASVVYEKVQLALALLQLPFCKEDGFSHMLSEMEKNPTNTRKTTQ